MIWEENAVIVHIMWGVNPRNKDIDTRWPLADAQVACEIQVPWIMCRPGWLVGVGAFDISFRGVKVGSPKRERGNK